MTNTPQLLYDSTKFDDRFAGNMWDQLNAIYNMKIGPALPTHDWWVPYVDWFKTEQGMITAGAIAVIAAIGVTVYAMRKLAQRGTGDVMGHWQRQQDLKKIISDILCDTVEEARYKDLISRAEKHALYKQMAKFFEQPDLIIQRHPSRKKAEIRQRIGNGVYKTKPSIPGEVPVVSVPTVKLPKRNRMVLKKTVRVQPVEA